MMFCGRLFTQGRDAVAAICDSDILGKRLKDDRFDVEVSESFYGSERINEAEALKIMENCTIGNLMGVKSVELARKSGFITDENVIYIGGVPHAQFVKVRAVE